LYYLMVRAAQAQKWIKDAHPVNQVSDLLVDSLVRSRLIGRSREPTQ
jgi:hypothetical protein